MIMFFFSEDLSEEDIENLLKTQDWKPDHIGHIMKRVKWKFRSLQKEQGAGAVGQGSLGTQAREGGGVSATTPTSSESGARSFRSGAESIGASQPSEVGLMRKRAQD